VSFRTLAEIKDYGYFGVVGIDIKFFDNVNVAVTVQQANFGAKYQILLIFTQDYIAITLPKANRQ
jgi:hypothetical protein